MTKVFIGSTSKDLEKYREAAIKTCNELGLIPVAMEFWEAMGVGATEGSKRKLDECDLYVGFFAFRYGYIEDSYDKSVTEIEFDYAGELGLDRLCFLADDNHPWPPSAMDPEHFDKLKAFKKCIDKSLIRAQFTTVDSFRAELMKSLVKWRDENGISGTATGTAETAILAQTPGDIPHRPRRLIGRDELAAEVHALLDENQTVLLRGSGGMGKTALAATVAAQRLADGKRPVLWLRTGDANADALFEALARPFGAQQTIAGTSGDAQVAALRTALAASGIKLLVLDDAWNGPALHHILDGVPSEIPVLVTSRQNFPIEGVSLDVGTLAPEKAVELLGYYAGEDYTGNDAAASLCALLGCHTYGVQIAGCTLRAEPGLTPEELHRRIENAPHALEMPLDFAEEGRESVGALLEVSLNALNGEARAVFLAFGALFAPTTTAELTALFFTDMPDIDDSMLAAAKEILPEEDRDEAGDEQLKSFLKQAAALHQNIDLSHSERILSSLVQRGLAERVPKDEHNVSSYRVHDLAYTYARAQSTQKHFGRALNACLAYTWRYNKPDRTNFAALRPLLDNFMAAAQWAMLTERFVEAERFAWNLYRGSEFLIYNGYYLQSISLLTLAVDAAEKRGDRQDQATHLGNLGLAYDSFGIYVQAIECYQKALTIYREIGYRLGEANQLGNLGLAYSNLEQHPQAIDYYKRALAIHIELGDRQGESNELGNLGNSYLRQGQYQQALEHHQRAVSVHREIGDRRNEGSDLSNLGNVYTTIGSFQEAINYYQQALAIRREIGDQHGEGIDLNNLGVVYKHLGQYELALDYYEKARAIRQKLGLAYEVERVDRNIARVRAKMAGEQDTDA